MTATLCSLQDVSVAELIMQFCNHMVLKVLVVPPAETKYKLYFLRTEIQLETFIQTRTRCFAGYRVQVVEHRNVLSFISSAPLHLDLLHFQNVTIIKTVEFFFKFTEYTQ